MNGLQLQGKWEEWAGRAGADSGYLALARKYIMGLWAFYQDHKSLLCKRSCPVDDSSNFFGAARCICFSANTVTKNCALAAIRHWLGGGKGEILEKLV